MGTSARGLGSNRGFRVNKHQLGKREQDMENEMEIGCK